MHSLQAKSRYLDRDDVLCLGTFLALRNSELDPLAFSQGLEAIANDSAEMRKHVGAGFLLDKAKTLGFVEAFNGSGSCRHSHILFVMSVRP